MYYAAIPGSQSTTTFETLINSEEERPDYLLFDFQSGVAGLAEVNFYSESGQSIDEFEFESDEVEIAVPTGTTRVKVLLRISTPIVISPAMKKGGNIGGLNITEELGTMTKLKYKVELPIGAKVTLFDDASLEVQFLEWNLPCPATLQSATFLQYKAANGFEQQSNASAGQQTMELWTNLGRRYAVFAEIWTYSSAQTLWFADLRVQLSDYEWRDIVPTAGAGGTIVTALPQ